MSVMDIRFVTTFEAAIEAVTQGYEPIECSFGQKGSALGALAMDHHGSESWREGVALRAYRDHFGARKGDQRFVVTGAADADATFAIAALAGILPHPSRAAELDKAPPPVKASGTRDLIELAKLIDRVDTAPVGVTLSEVLWGDTLLLWNDLGSSNQDAISFYAGVDRWRAVLGRPLKALKEATKKEAQDNVDVARAAKREKLGDVLCVDDCPVFGFMTWYEEADVVVAFAGKLGAVTIGVRDAVKAVELFGPKGLMEVFPSLGEGWGGREAIGGSPRGQKMTYEDAAAAARIVDAAIRR